MNATDKRHRIADGLRNLFYPLVPVIAVGTIWAIAWAKSVESRVVSECGPIRTDPEGDYVAMEAPHPFQLPSELNPPAGTAADRQD